MAVDCDITVYEGLQPRCPWCHGANTGWLGPLTIFTAIWCRDCDYLRFGPTPMEVRAWARRSRERV